MDRWNSQQIGQIQLPSPADDDEHPRLMLNGEGISAGQTFTALFPDDWHEVTFETNWGKTGVACWYIANEDFHNICPIGLFVKL